MVHSLQCLLLSVATAAEPQLPSHTNRSSEDILRLFGEFQEKYGQMNSADAFSNFEHYVGLVDRHPTNPPLLAGCQLSHLAVLSQTEFEETFRGCAKVRDLVPTASASQVGIEDLPTEFDWRDHGAVTPVKDQGQCGSCWAFSTTGLLESAWSVAGHGLQLLSEQQLVSCDTADGNSGCNGGWPYLAVDYVRDHGIDTEQSYPYSSSGGDSGTCQASSGSPAAIQVASYSIVQSDEGAMAAWLAKNGPLSISIDAMTSLWWAYTGGIVSTCTGTDVDHAVLIVGFGVQSGQQYWVIKNSWSNSWGEGGYIRLERGSNQCGITFQPLGALVSDSPKPPPSPDGWIAHPDVYFHSSQQIEKQDQMTIAAAKEHCAELSGCKGFTVKAAADAGESATIYFENGLDTVYAAGWTAFEMPTGPMPSPSPVPVPTPRPVPVPPPTPAPTPVPSSSCPADADHVVRQDGREECLWSSGVHGLEIPASASQYCDYIHDGYFGYIWPMSDGEFDCASSARSSNNGVDYFCTWNDGEHGVTIPSDAVADCDHIGNGKVGIILSATTQQFQI